MKVVLSADGGDELFGGYSHYQHVSNLYRRFHRMPAGLRKKIARGLTVAAPGHMREKIVAFNTEHKLYALEELMRADDHQHFFEAYLANQTQAEISNLVTGTNLNELNGVPSLGLLQTMMAWDLRYYLPDDLLVKVDRATMYFSTECREPFLDHRLVEFAMQMPDNLKVRNGKGKYILRKLLGRYLPENLFERKKQGFSIPIFSWFTRELDEMFNQHLSIEKLKQVPFISAREVTKELMKYKYYKKKGKQYNIEKMWRILSFMLWWETHMKR